MAGTTSRCIRSIICLLSDSSIIVSRVLSRAEAGISKQETEEIIREYGFAETAFHLLPALTDGAWHFLEKRNDLYHSRLSAPGKRPLSVLEQSFLAAILLDPRIRLFLSEEKTAELKAALSGVIPAFDGNDFVSVDRHLDGDPYDAPVYVANFRKILQAVKHHDPVVIAYDSEKTGRSQRTYHPFKLSYSALNDKFRLLCAVFNTKTQTLNKVVLNLGKIVSVGASELPYRAAPEDLSKLFAEPDDNPPLTVEITKERNALERFLLQFASFDRQTEYDPVRDVYTCQITYDPADEPELLIRILSFGPTVKAIAPQSFLDQIKERLKQQLLLHK